jgi:hypothetical protein
VDVTDLVYDGARVVQELGMRVFDAVVLEPPTGGVDLTPKTRALTAIDLAGGGSMLLNPSQGRVLRREYAYALDEAADVDECIAQWSYADPHPPSNPILESEGSTWPVLAYVLQDANLNVVGLTDALGHPVAHYDYTPYGVTRTAIHADHSSLPADLSALVTALSNRLGHQGLRFERLDRPWESLYGDIPSVAATSVGGAGQVFDPSEVGTSSGTVTALGSFHGVYLNRNRVYEPWIGRFTSVDPNGLGGPVQIRLTFRGVPPLMSDVDNQLSAHYRDGWAVHSAYAQSPFMRRDAAGLVSELDAIEAPAALGALEMVRVRVMMFTIQHWSGISTAIGIGYAGVAGEADPTGMGNPALAMEANMLMKSVGSSRSAEFLTQASGSFRENLRRLTGYAPEAIAGLEAHHIIPQSPRIVSLLNTLGLGELVHSPLFGQFMNNAEHTALHAGSARGGLYNAEWEIFLDGLVKKNVDHNEAAQKLMNFITEEIGPRYLW